MFRCCRSAALSFTALMLLFCSPAEAAAPAPGTVRMAERLREFNQQAGLTNPYANLARAKKYLAQRNAATNAAESFDAQLQMSLELLRAGQPDPAQRGFQALADILRKQGRLTRANELELHRLQAIALLRLGEQENCLLNHTADSCLFPIAGAGVHKVERGSRGAVHHLQAILELAPEDLAARWLLNIAHMTLGEYPDKVPARWRIDPKLFHSEAEVSRFYDIARSLGLDVDGLAGGSVAEDFDNDGFIDLFCSTMQWDGQLRFFRNNGHGTFTEKTEEAGLIGEVDGLNLTHADYDNDGFSDLLVLRGGWQGAAGRRPNSLLRNQGDGTFADVTEAAGLLSFHPTQTAAWLDFNNDGWLDLFIGNESTGAEIHPCELYRNNKDGTFTECAAASGVAVVGFVKAVAAGDFNNDGRSDLYVSRLGEPNLLFRNEGPNDPAGAGRFTDVTLRAGVAEPINSFPAWFFDYDNDGWQDLFVAGYFLNDVGLVAADYLGLPHSGERARLYRNRGDGTFENTTETAGLNKVLLAMGSNYGDLDNDGFLDFYVGTGDPDFSMLIPNRMFKNDRGQRFLEVTSSGGFGHLQKGHGVSFADFDNDGDSDVYQTMGGAYLGDNYRNVLYHNPGHGNAWVKLHLVGRRSNRAALGARVAIRTSSGRRAIHRTVSSGGSFGDSPFLQTIGLGRNEGIDEVEVTWPVTGKRQVFRSLAAYRCYRIAEDEPAPKEITLRTLQFPQQTHLHR